MLWIEVALLTLGIFVVAFVLFHFARLGMWIYRGGGSVIIPWTVTSPPPWSPFAHLRRTRDGSKFSVRNEGSCCLIFWKLPPRPGLGAFLGDAISGFAGICTVAADCSLESQGEPWLIKSGPWSIQNRLISGPHYMALAACPLPVMARVDISEFIDARQLLRDLQERISCPAVRHKSANPLLYLLGSTRPDRVTCSSLIGLAILRQDSTPLERALRLALRERFTYGEITPADLARALAILGLSPQGTKEPIRTAPWWEGCDILKAFGGSRYERREERAAARDHRESPARSHRDRDVG